MTPTIQWTRLESLVPPEYERPKPDYSHDDPLALGNEYDGYYIEDYLGSPGTDHRHYHFGDLADPEFHNHHLHDPYARERRYQPHPEEYFVPVVVDPVPAPRTAEPEAKYVEDDGGALELLGTPLDLQYYLSGDHLKNDYYDHYPEEPRYSYKPYHVVAEESELYLEPVHDDLSFLFDHKPKAKSSYSHSSYR